MAAGSRPHIQSAITLNGALVAEYAVVVGETLAEIPDVPAKAGYDQTEPYWDIDLTGVAITQDYTVNAVYTENIYIVGDVNGDGVIGFGDVAMLYMAIVGGAPLSEDGLSRADVTGDGIIDFADLAALYLQIVNSGRGVW